MAGPPHYVKFHGKRFLARFLDISVAPTKRGNLQDPDEVRHKGIIAHRNKPYVHVLSFFIAQYIGTISLGALNPQFSQAMILPGNWVSS